MNLLAISVTTAVLASGVTNPSGHNEVLSTSLSEYCAMETRGYLSTSEAKQLQQDSNFLPRPFSTKPTMNYTFVQSNQLPELCNIYIN